MERLGFRIVQRNEGQRSDLGRLSANAERTYWRLMLASDAHGCHRGEAIAVAGNAMVGIQKLTVRAVEQALAELVAHRIIDVWEADDGAMWLEIRGFDERQTPNCLEHRHARIAPPRPPDIDDDTGSAVPANPKAPKPTDAAAHEARTSDAVQRVFDHWAAGEKRTGGNSRPMLTPDRRKRIKARLDDGFTVEQLCECIDGFHASPFHLGQNDRDTRYTDLMTMLKSSQQVDAGIQKAKQGGGPARRFGTGERVLDERFSVYDK